MDAGGDAVIVATGDYALSSPLVVNKPIHVHGAAGQPRPRLVSSSPGAVNASGAGLTLSDLQIEGPGSSATAVVFGQTLASGTSVLERLTVLGGPGANGSAVRVGRGWIVRDSFIRTTAPNGYAVIAFPSNAGNITRFVNLTAIATDPGGTAIFADTSTGGIWVPPFTIEVHATNVIARGGLYDLSVPNVCSGTSSLGSGTRTSAAPR